MNKLSFFFLTAAFSTSINGATQSIPKFKEFKSDTLSVNDSTKLVMIMSDDLVLHRGTLNSDNQRNGIWEVYYYNQQKRISAEFIAGLAHNACTYYYANGNIQASISYSFGKPYGHWKSYYENGDIQAEIKWDNSTHLPATVRVYHKKGLLALQKSYAYSQNDVQINMKSFYSNGAPFEEFILYQNIENLNSLESYLSTAPHLGVSSSPEGKLSGYYTRSYMSARPWVQLYLESDSLQEVIFQYDPNQELLSTDFKNGTGELTLNHHNGDPAIESSYESGLKNGPYKLFYKEGNTRVTGEYLDDSPIDTWRFSSFSGKKKSEITFKGDTILTLDYGPNNKLHRKYRSIDGLIEGDYVTYDFFGDTTSLCSYSAGLLNGKYESFFRNNLFRRGFYKCGEQIDHWTTKGQFNEVSHRTVFQNKNVFCNREHLPRFKNEINNLILCPGLLKTQAKDPSTYNHDIIILSEKEFQASLLTPQDSDEIWGNTVFSFRIDASGEIKDLEIIKSPDLATSEVLRRNFISYSVFAPSFKCGFPISPKYFLDIKHYR